MPKTRKIKTPVKTASFIQLAAHVQRYLDFTPIPELAFDDYVNIMVTVGQLRELQRLLADCRELSETVKNAQMY